MKHFLTTQDYSQNALQALLNQASELKSSPFNELMKNRTIGLVFLNPSLRTRTSFQIGAQQLGGHAVIIDAGNSWPICHKLGAAMDGDAEEHIIEFTQVLSSYCDLIAVRSFPKFESWENDRCDSILASMAHYASVPVINMETIVHPCQELAHMLMLQEKLGDVKNKKYVLTWAWHPKPLNSAVANSSLLIASKFGMDVTLLCPNQEYILDETFINNAQHNANISGGSLTISHDIASAYDGADVIYAKSWGALPYFGRWDQEKIIRDQYQHFLVNEEKMAKTNNALFSHCLPMRRNVIVSDSVANSHNAAFIHEAENRIPVQKAVMIDLLK